jgi:hypothetical protein
LTFAGAKGFGIIFLRVYYEYRRISMKDSSIGIGLLGLGTVGSGVYKLLRENELQISQRTGKRLEIKKILERDQKKGLLFGDTTGGPGGKY